MPMLLLLAGLTAVLAWLLPNHYPPWTTFHSDLCMALAFLLGGAWASWNLRQHEGSISLLALATLMTSVIPGVQLLAGLLRFAGDFWISLLYLLGISLSIAFGARLAQVHGAEAVLDGLSWVLLAGAVSSVGIQLYQWQGLEGLGSFVADLPPGGRPYANLAQPNLLALLLSLGLGATAWLHHAGRLGGFVAVLLLLLLGFGLAMTQSRAALLAVSVAIFWLLSQRAQLGPRLQPRRLLLAVCVVLAWLWVWPMLASSAPVPAGRALGADLKGGNRLILWASMLDALGRQPWSGYGWLQVAEAHAGVAIDHPRMITPELFEDVHNLPLQLLVWCGLPIGLILLGILLAWAWKVIRGAREPVAVMGLAMLALVATQAMLEFPYMHAYLVLPTGLMMGAIESSTAPSLSIRAKAGLLPALTLCAGVLTLLVARDYFPLEEEMRAIRFEQRGIGLSSQRPQPPDTLLLTQLDTWLAVSRYAPRRGMSLEELDRLNRAASRYPYAYLRLRQALGLGLNGKPEAASAALRSICPTHSVEVCESSRVFWKRWVEKEPVLAEVKGP